MSKLEDVPLRLLSFGQIPGPERHAGTEQQVPVLLEHQALYLGRAVPGSMHAADHRAHAVAGYRDHGDALALKHLQYTDVSEAERRPAGKREPDPHRRLDRDRLTHWLLGRGTEPKQTHRDSYPPTAQRHPPF